MYTRRNDQSIWSDFIEIAIAFSIAMLLMWAMTSVLQKSNSEAVVLPLEERGVYDSLRKRETTNPTNRQFAKGV